MFYVTGHGQGAMNFLLIPQFPPPPFFFWEMQEDETGNLRNVLEKDVIMAWHTYMGYLYLLGGICCPTKVYFKLSTLAGDSR